MQKLFSKRPHVASQSRLLPKLPHKVWQSEYSRAVLFAFFLFPLYKQRSFATSESSYCTSAVWTFQSSRWSSYDNYDSTFKLANQLFPDASSPVLTLFHHFNSATLLEQNLGLSVQQEQKTASREQLHATDSKHFHRESQPEEPQCLVADQLLAF